MPLALALALTLASTQAAPASTAVLVGRRTSVPAADAHALAQALSQHLTAAKVPVALDADGARAALTRLGLKEAAACAGKKACLVELGKMLSVSHLVVVSVSQVGTDRSLALELVQVSDASVVERDGLVLAPKAKLSPDLTAAFAGRAAAALTPAAPPPPTPPVVEVKPPPAPDAPLSTAPPATALVPAPTAPRTGLEASPPPPAEPRSHSTAFVLGTAAVVALAAATGLAIAGSSARADATRTETVDGVVRSPLKASEVLSRLTTANTELGAAAGVGALAIGLGVGAVWTW